MLQLSTTQIYAKCLLQKCNSFHVPRFKIFHQNVLLYQKDNHTSVMSGHTGSLQAITGPIVEFLWPGNCNSFQEVLLAAVQTLSLAHLYSKPFCPVGLQILSKRRHRKK